MLYEIDRSPSFRLHLYNNSVARKWKTLIDSIYVGDGEDIDHRRTFFKFQTKENAKNILITAIKNVNSFLKHEFITIPTKWDKETFNNLHITFERLSGDHDNPTKLVKIAPIKIKESIRDINYCIHTLENPNIETKDLSIEWTKKREQTHRVKLESNDYELVQFHKNDGEVYLEYNELGKPYSDLFADGLPITYKATKNKHYIGADILLSFTDNKDIFGNKFIKWLKNNNIDPYNKKLGLGLVPIGKVEIIKIDHLTKDSKANIIKE
jgi:hypothetical protein